MSDRELRAHQRLAQSNAEDPATLWKYIRSLERVCGPTPTSPVVEIDPIRRHLSLAMAESGLSSLDDLSRITTIPQFRELVGRLFPFGEIGYFATEEWDHDCWPSGEAENFLLVRTGVYGYREIPPSLEGFFQNHGYLLHLEKGDEVVWCAPFKSANPAWSDGIPEQWRARQSRDQAWENQGLVYFTYPPKP